MSLYLNGSLYAEQSACKVFVFEVALKDGMNTVAVSAGTVRDAIVLEKVDREPEVYTVPEPDEDPRKGAPNWFKMPDLTAMGGKPEGSEDQ